MRNNQRGGLKQKNPDKKGFLPVYDMVNSRNANLNLLSYESLKGFIISLTVDSNDSEYKGLSNGRFTKNVTDFIMKFAVVAPSEKIIPPFNTLVKMSESRESYFNEAKLQQNIWIRSIIGGREEVCPPVANFSLFNNSQSKLILNFFISKSNNMYTHIIFNYLNYVINADPTYEIGIILMPIIGNIINNSIHNSIEFSKFMLLPINTNFNGLIINNDEKDNAMISVASKVARLFIDIGVIHFDLHSNNILICVTPQQKIKSYIIDFGRASNILSDTPDSYYNVNEKKVLASTKKILYNNLLDNIGKDGIDKKKFILDFLDNIKLIDKGINQKRMKYNNPNAYQMYWYESYPRDNNVPEKTYDLLESSIITIDHTITNTTITNYKNNGFIIDFETDINNFVVNFPISNTITNNRAATPPTVLTTNKRPISSPPSSISTPSLKRKNTNSPNTRSKHSRINMNSAIQQINFQTGSANKLSRKSKTKKYTRK